MESVYWVLTVVEVLAVIVIVVIAWQSEAEDNDDLQL